MALRGTREQRTVLVRDPNKVIAIAVMGSPKLNPTEVESYARMTSVQEEVPRRAGAKTLARLRLRPSRLRLASAELFSAPGYLSSRSARPTLLVRKLRTSGVSVASERRSKRFQRSGIQHIIRFGPRATGHDDSPP